MLSMESSIQDSLNEAGLIGSKVALERFDTDGSPIIIANQKLTVQRKHNESYQTPYGVTEVKRNIYQNSKGGKTFCPLEAGARIVGKATPRFARMISFKYGQTGAKGVQKDLMETLNRSASVLLIQNISEEVGAYLNLKEECWEYAPPVLDANVRMVSVGLDGTTLRMLDGKYREAMVGTIALYDKEGERLHTIYLGASPESGKEQFLERLEREVKRTRSRYRNLTFIGLADGAPCNWTFLNDHTDVQILDFYHASEYLTLAAEAKFSSVSSKYEWLNDACHRLKHNKTGPSALLKEMKSWRPSVKGIKKKKDLERSITYFSNQKKRMLYAVQLKENHPIGSGVTEAAAKVIIKQRLGKSGARWSNEGAGIVMQLRSLGLSGNRWDQAWENIDQYGYSKVAA